MATPTKVLETLKLTLQVPATCARVRELAKMFEDTLRAIDDGVEKEAVTLVVSNYVAKVELRARSVPGARAVRLTKELVDNPADAVQEHPLLAPAAVCLADHMETLLGLGPQFWTGRKKIRDVDDVLVRTMRAAGTPKTPLTRGNTVVFSPVLRFGRPNANSTPKARIQLHGRPVDATFNESLTGDLAKAAADVKIFELHVDGYWSEGPDGMLMMVKPRITQIRGFETWTPHDLLADFAQNAAHLFTADDFDRMLADGDVEE